MNKTEFAPQQPEQNDNTHDQEDNALNDLFAFDKDQMQADQDDEVDPEEYESYDGTEYKPEQEEEKQEEEEEEENDSLFGDENEEEEEEDAPESEEEDFTDADLALFNKKLNKDFQNVEELKKFLDKDDEDKKDDKKPVNDLEEAQNVMDYLSPLIDPQQTDDETLLRKDLEVRAMNNGKDLADEEVQFDIDEKIQRLKDSYQVDLRAREIRNELTGIYNEKKSVKERIQNEEQQAEQQRLTAEKEATMDAFAEISKMDSFFGVKPEKEVLRKAFKSANSGEFINRLKSDKNLLAKLAVLDAYGDEIHKKASSGLTYNDGLKAVRDEFKGAKDKSSGTAIVQAQKKGTAASSKNSYEGLVASLAK